MPHPAVAVFIVGKLSKTVGALKLYAKGSKLSATVLKKTAVIRQLNKQTKVPRLMYRLRSIMQQAPVPLFGNFYVASRWGMRKASSLPRYAPWILPVTAGSLYFIWPAVTDETKVSMGLLPDPYEVKKETTTEHSLEQFTVAASGGDEDKNIEDGTATEKRLDVEESEDENLDESEDANNNESEEKSDDEIEDDFSDLPEEDEETTCAICLINRQGPCRNLWRRFERCIKEQPVTGGDEGAENMTETKEEKEEDESALTNEASPPSATSAAVASKCDHVFMPWFQCFNDHRVTYALITNKQVQPEMDLLEEQQKVDHFPEELVPVIASTHDEDSDEKDDQRRQEEKASEHIVTKYAKFQLKNSATGNDVHVAYVRDDEGNLLGFDYFNAERKEGKHEGEMMFHVKPNTAAVSLFAFYRTKDEEEQGEFHSNGDDDEETKLTQNVNEKVYMRKINLTMNS